MVCIQSSLEATVVYFRLEFFWQSSKWGQRNEVLSQCFLSCGVTLTLLRYICGFTWLCVDNSFLLILSVNFCIFEITKLNDLISYHKQEICHFVKKKTKRHINACVTVEIGFQGYSQLQNKVMRQNINYIGGRVFCRV